MHAYIYIYIYIPIYICISYVYVWESTPTKGTTCKHKRTNPLPGEKAAPGVAAGYHMYLWALACFAKNW